MRVAGLLLLFVVAVVVPGRSNGTLRGSAVVRSWYIPLNSTFTIVIKVKVTITAPPIQNMSARGTSPSLSKLANGQSLAIAQLGISRRPVAAGPGGGGA
jgi:hypothetical protein